ncbi:YceI family protein [Nakamurella flavida]|uniref:YceI family protein n=1 Tax=Nakamurella flavida TaxID=363630 RepID=A0A939C3F1_9ACTN|nr:YceI family protein [Nakamurella flavida]MBM9477001.1 YceI family protein [Nakamurella flavida]MDP9779946.1 polyisoprenoid-binding protein YceI [Nakamurella flavida]
MTSTETPTLTGTWTADAVHSDVSFKVRHMAVGKARGKFDLADSTLTVGEDGLAGASVVATIDATSVDTNNEQRDQHVHSPDFLHTAQYPTLTFRSTGVRNLSGDDFLLDGELTIRDTTKPVTLEVEHLGATVDAYGADRVGFTATTSISRKEYGVSFEAAFGAGNAVVADKVEITLELEYVRAQA